MPDEDEPLFSLDDYVSPGSALPDHLKGKTPEQVAEYYSAQLRLGEEKAAERQRVLAEAQPPKKEAAAQLKALTEADVLPALGTMIASAKIVAKSSLDAAGQQLFDRFATDIDLIMKAGFRGVQLADAQNWIFAYNQVLGSKASVLMKEAKDSEAARRTAESSSAGATPPEEPVTLSPVQEAVANSLGIGADGYKKGLEHIRKDQWPMTFSNR